MISVGARGILVATKPPVTTDAFQSNPAGLQRSRTQRGTCAVPRRSHTVGANDEPRTRRCYAESERNFCIVALMVVTPKRSSAVIYSQGSRGLAILGAGGPAFFALSVLC